MTRTMGSLDGKNILITGTTGHGVGRGVAEAVAEAGGVAVMHGPTFEEAEEAAAQVPGAVPIACALEDPTAIEKLFNEACERVDTLHGVVNNAGVGLNKDALAATADEFDYLFAVDVRAVWLLARKAIEHWRERGMGGSIVNVSSIHAAATMKNYSLYAAAKGAVESLTRGLAVEFGRDGIRCNAISPGYVHSEQGLEIIAAWADDPRKWARDYVSATQPLPDEIDALDCGRAAVFLLSEQSRRITGEVLRVDGGSVAMLFNTELIADSSRGDRRQTGPNATRDSTT